jgi:excisionase family DNA binding protein
MSEDPKFLTIEEAARLIGISHWSIRQWQRLGRLTRFKIGRRTLVNRAELLALISRETEIEAR